MLILDEIVNCDTSQTESFYSERLLHDSSNILGSCNGTHRRKWNTKGMSDVLVPEKVTPVAVLSAARMSLAINL